VVLLSLSDLLSGATQGLLPRSSLVGQVSEHVRASRKRLLNFDRRCLYMLTFFWPTSNNIWGDERMSRTDSLLITCGLRANG